jgi:hypothetical protein
MSLHNVDLSAAPGVQASFKGCVAPMRMNTANVCIEDAVAMDYCNWMFAVEEGFGGDDHGDNRIENWVHDDGDDDESAEDVGWGEEDSSSEED